MRRLSIFALALVVSMSAWAQSVAFGNKLVNVGDSIGRVYEVAGKPARVVQLENKFGANIGERLEYFIGSKTVLITIRGGTVVNVVEVF